MAVQVLIYRISNESSESFIQGRNAVQAALAGDDVVLAANWLSTEVTHNEENDYIDIMITYDDTIVL